MAVSGTLDHVPFGATDLERAGRAMARLGFAVSDVGACRWTLAGSEQSARSSCVVFRACYLDLIEIRDPGWRERLEASMVYAAGLAPTGVVLACADPDAERTRLLEAGLKVHPAYDIDRSFEPESSPRESASLHYRIASLDRNSTSLPFSLLRDDTPEALRRPAWLAHPNGAIAISRLHLRVPSLDGAMADAKLVVPDAVRDGSTLALGCAAAELAEAPRDDWTERIFEALGRPERTALLALEFAVSDLDRAEKLLRDHAVGYACHGDRLLVDPAEGVGCGFAFTTV